VADRCDLLCLDLPVAERIRARTRGLEAQLREAADRAQALSWPCTP
jgi:hypothetical protein